MSRRIEQVLRDGVAQGDAPGCVALVVDREDVRYAGAFGVRSLADGTPMTVDTTFRLASMTKAIGSVAALQLVEQGRLHLDQPVASLVPEFAELGVLTGFYGDTPAIRPARSAATLRQVLTHTSGCAYEFWNGPMAKWVRLTGNPGPLSCTREALRRPLVCDPGSAWVYGTSTDWAGLMVEAASGDTLDVYLERHVTGPLGMSDTRFQATPDMDARLTGLHHRDAHGAWAPMPFAWPDTVDLWNAGHRLHGTAGDYGRFLQMLLNEGTHAGTRVLEARTVALAGENHIGDLMVTCLESVAPAFVCDAEFQPGTRKKHGLAAVISCEQLPGRRAPGSSCWAGVFNTFFWFDPTHGIGAVLMTQTLPFADPAVMRLLDAFEEAVYADLA